MKDLLFTNNDEIGMISESTRNHQQDIILMHEGWDKFAPHIGVAIMDRLDNDETSEDLKNAISINFEKDKMKVNNIVVSSDGSIYTDANY